MQKILPPLAPNELGLSIQVEQSYSIQRKALKKDAKYPNF